MSNGKIQAILDAYDQAIRTLSDARPTPQTIRAALKEELEQADRLGKLEGGR